MRKIILNADKEKPILYGHPWVFPKAINNDSNKIRPGELVGVYDHKQQLIGHGVYNPHSLYRVRILSYANELAECQNLEDILILRISQAITLRAKINLPSPSTTAYRLINSEGDGLSGLIIDVYNDICVVQCMAYWVELNRTLISSILTKTLCPRNVVWISHPKSLKQDGWEHNIEQKAFEQSIDIRLNNIQYQINFATIQKTGFFLDQRENHQRIADLAKNKSVLDLYCFTGGFAINAAKGGAKKITAVDSSLNAIDQAKINAQMNGVTEIDFIADDARTYLQKASDYDLVIVDPPKIIPTRKDLPKGEKYYRHLHSELFKVMPKHSLLLTCNCSAAMTEENFIKLIDSCAVSTRRHLKILGSFGPAMDHPTLGHFREGNYLHAILLAL